jgi:CubicO group peptidase (beta-lactamase class C family)
VLAALPEDAAVVAVSFGSPYVAQQLPVGCSYVCAYARTARTERAAAAVLLGLAPVTGRLPVTIPGVAAAGDGRSLLPGTEAPRGRPEEEGLDGSLAERIRALLRRAIGERAFPGAVCLVARRGRVVAEVAEGRRGYEEGDAEVSAGTPYDLASLTKVCATAPAVLRLAAQGRLSLDDPVQKWVPAFQGIGKEHVTVRHLLAHAGGLPAYERWYLTLAGKDAIVAATAAEGLTSEPGERVVYSDLGFVLLMAVVESCSGEPFAEFVQREVWAPLGMRGAAFAPAGGPPVDSPPTEADPQRGGIVRGRVHDENAFAMGGVSGHAGMFATADDVLRVGLLMLGSGRGFLPSPLVAQALAPAAAVGSARALGFDLPGAGGWAGTAVSPGTFGHTGFTGTSLWCDSRLDLCVVLLTNRVHPTRDNGRIAAARRQLHDLVLGLVER